MNHRSEGTTVLLDLLGHVADCEVETRNQDRTRVEGKLAGCGVVLGSYLTEDLYVIKPVI